MIIIMYPSGIPIFPGDTIGYTIPWLNPKKGIVWTETKLLVLDITALLDE